MDCEVGRRGDVFINILVWNKYCLIFEFPSTNLQTACVNKTLLSAKVECEL